MSLLEHQKLWGKQGKSLGSEFNTRDMWLSHTPRPWRLQPATQQSHFSNRWEQEFHFRHCFYFIYHISSIHLMLTIAGLYELNIAQHFLECRRYSFLITQDNCSNISLPAWFHMAHHRIQSNKCVCVRAVQRNSQKVLWKQNQTEQLQRQNCIMFHVQKNYCSFYCLVNRAEVWLCGCNIF